MTYQELLEELQKLDSEQLECNVAVYLKGVDEHIPVYYIAFAYNSDVLTNSHPILGASY